MSREEQYLDEFPDDELLTAGRMSASEGSGEYRISPVDTARTLGDWASRDEDITQDPFFEPGSVRAVLHAYSEGASGSPRWTEPCATVDFFGQPTVFSSKFNPLDRRTK
jgi:hypothetical protein